MFTTKQDLNNNRFSQKGSDILLLTGGTSISNLTGYTAYLSTIKTFNNLDIVSDNIKFINGQGKSGSYNTNFKIGGGFNASPTFVSEFDGKLMFGGSISYYNDIQNIGNLILLNNDETKDTTFNIGTGFGGALNGVIKSGTTYLVYGSFTTFTGQSNNYLIRLNSNGSKDTTFNIGSGFNSAVLSVAIQPDGKILVGGGFTTFTGSTNNRLIRLNSNGTKDTSFNIGTGFNAAVYSIEVQPDGKILVGGYFTTFTGQTNNCLIRLNSNGTKDTTFNIGTGFGSLARVNKVVIQPDGKILVGGGFSTFTGQTNNFLIRLNSNGSKDNTFNIGTGFNGNVVTILLESNGKILVGGGFTTFTGSTNNRLIRLNSDGTKDTTFYSPTKFTTSTVTSIIKRLNGNYVIVGSSVYDEISLISKRKYVIELTSTSSVVSSFSIKNTGFPTGTYVSNIIIDSNGELLIGGNFPNFNEASSSKYFIKINKDSTLDTTFLGNGKFNGSVETFKYISGGTKILVGGTFNMYDVTSYNRLVKLNSNGSLDTSFNIGSGFNSNVSSISIQPDNKILVGGNFTTFNGTQSLGLVRLNTNGGIDSTLNLPQLNNAYGGGSSTWSSYIYSIKSIHIQPSGKIVICGSISLYDEGDILPGLPYVNNFAIRLESNGTVDATTWGYYFPGIGGGINSNVLSPTCSIMLPDGKIIFGGDFTDIFGYSTGYTMNRIVRLTVNGQIDTSFNSGTGFAGGYPQYMEFDTDGGIIIGGSFTSYNGNPCNGFVKIKSDGTYDGTLITETGFKTGSVINTIGVDNNNIVIGGTFDYYQNHLSKNVVLLDKGGKYIFDIIKGIEYSSDVSNNLGDLSLTHKKYVNDYVLSKTNVFGNGLTVSGNSVSVGGTLTKNIDFNIGSNSLNFSGNSNTLKFISTGNTGMSIIGNTGVSIKGNNNLNLYIKNDNHLKLYENSGVINDNFKSGPSFNDYVNICVTQNDGKFIFGGNFSKYSGITSNKIIRINIDGTIDTTFNIGTGFNNKVESIAIQPDGKILVGGSFTAYNDQLNNYFIRLNTDGTKDNTFNTGTGFDGQVFSIVIQPDNKILVGGWFITYNGQSNNFLIRLNSDGTKDTSFNIATGFNNRVDSIAIQPDGKILVGGIFSTFTGQTNSRLIRLNSNGTKDTTFNIGTGFDNDVYSIAIQSDGKILVGGLFYTFTGQTNSRLIRLNSNGTKDTTFNIGTGFNGDVRSIVKQLDGKILVGGGFISFTGATNNQYLIRLNDNGTKDISFNVNLQLSGSFISGFIKSILLQSDGKILIGGFFNLINFNKPRKNTALIESNGNVNNNIFNILNGGFNSYVYDAIQQSDNKILVCGDFTSYNGYSINRLIRLNLDGTKDTTFNIGTGFGGAVRSIVIQPDGKTLVGGQFTTFTGQSNNYLIRLNSNGSKDTTFNIGTGFENGVYSVVLQLDGKILVGGNFITFTGITNNRLIRLNSNGTKDTTFNIGTGFNSTVLSVAIQPDGKILVGGQFTTFTGSTNNRLIRLNSDGTKDTSFNIGTGFGGDVNSIVLQPDGKILVGGWFTTYNGQINNYLIRLNSNGTKDTSFNIGTGFNWGVYSITLQPDGMILVGGKIKTYKDQSINQIIRLYPDGTLDTLFNKPGVTYDINNTEYNVNVIIYLKNGNIFFGGFQETFNDIAIQNGAIIDDNHKVVLSNKIGVEYESDYSSEYTTRSLVDKGYVDNKDINENILILTGNTILSSTSSKNILVNHTSPITVTLPLSPNDGRVFYIKDISGNALTNNITVNGNGKNIDGSASVVINTNYGSLKFIYSLTLNSWYMVGSLI